MVRIALGRGILAEPWRRHQSRPCGWWRGKSSRPKGAESAKGRGREEDRADTSLSFLTAVLLSKGAGSWVVFFPLC